MAIEILVLAQEDCAFCDHARDVLARLGDEFDLEIRTVEMNSDEVGRLAAEGAILFPPGIFVEGKAFSYGRLSERKLRKHFVAFMTSSGMGAIERRSAHSRPVDGCDARRHPSPPCSQWSAAVRPPHGVTFGPISEPGRRPPCN